MKSNVPETARVSTGGQRPVLTHEEIWRRYDAVEVRLTASLSERMLDLAGIQPGMRVLDLERRRTGGVIRLGGVTRIVRARPV